LLCQGGFGAPSSDQRGENIPPAGRGRKGLLRKTASTTFPNGEWRDRFFLARLPFWGCSKGRSNAGKTLRLLCASRGARGGGENHPVRRIHSKPKFGTGAPGTVWARPDLGGWPGMRGRVFDEKKTRFAAGAEIRPKTVVRTGFRPPPPRFLFFLSAAGRLWVSWPGFVFLVGRIRWIAEKARSAGRLVPSPGRPGPFFWGQGVISRCFPRLNRNL